MKLKIEDVKEIDNIEAVHESEIKKIGNGAMLHTLKKYIGKKAIVIVLKEDPRKRLSISKKRHKTQEKEFKKEFED